MTIVQSLATLLPLLGYTADGRTAADLSAVAPQVSATARLGEREQRQIVIPVEGMGCESCADRLQSKLAHLDGVSQATVDFAKREARVTFDPRTITAKQIVAEINKVFTAGEPKTEDEI